MRTPDQSAREPSSNKELLRLLLKHQRAIYSYIYTLVPNASNADDLLQETCLTIYEKFDDFEPGTDFLLWANRIAYWKIRQARQKFSRSKVVFDETLMEAVSNTAIEMQRETGDRHEMLSRCLSKLNDRDRRMVLTRYEPEGTIEEAAQVSGRSVTATYKALSRIRQLLYDCITYNLENNATKAIS
ncbi:MAG: sigma-70 family RNA polymerase sigma factor [Verrucomicrobiota bacterium]